MKPEQLVARFERAAKGAEIAPRKGVLAAGKYVERAALASLAESTHGTLRLRGVRNGQMGVLTRLVGSSGATSAVTVKAVPGGLWSWLNSGVSKHVVGAGRGKVGLSKNEHGVLYAFDKKNGKTYTAKKLHIGDRVVYGPFMAGGSPAKLTWTRAIEASLPALPEIMRRETDRAVLDAFRGK